MGASWAGHSLDPNRASRFCAKGCTGAIGATVRELCARVRIIQTMRVWLLALMIALLPLRGWVGDAMALAAWPAAVASAPESAPPCHGEMAMPMVHHHDAHAADTAPLAHNSDGSEHVGCNSCDICHGTVLGGHMAFAGMLQAPSAQPAPAHSRFASAVLPGQHKPPIA
jgi:hypothetical protein